MPGSLKQTLMTRFHSSSEYWTPPREVTLQQVQDAKTYDLAMRESVRPVDVENYLKPRLAAFLAHHFAGALGSKANALIAVDWIKTLMPFPQDVIDKAINYWVAHESKKPLPAQIRHWCIHFFGTQDWEQWERAQKIAAMNPTAPRLTAGDAEEWRKPTPEEIAKTLTMMHENGFHLDKRQERCPLCQAQKVDA